jgi:Tfp pilus assembly major pilin PilA
MMQKSSEKGFSLAETMIALGVLTTGVLGAAGVLAAGMQNLNSSASDVVVAQKATEAVESVFAARDSHKVTWSQINNVSRGGVFLDAATSLTTAGNDGLVNTADDGPIETIVLPTGTVTLTGYTRKIYIQDVPNENSQLRSIVVTITYSVGGTTRTYTLTTFISAYS